MPKYRGGSWTTCHRPAQSACSRRTKRRAAVAPCGVVSGAPRAGARQVGHSDRGRAGARFQDPPQHFRGWWCFRPAGSVCRCRGSRKNRSRSGRVPGPAPRKYLRPSSGLSRWSTSRPSSPASIICSKVSSPDHPAAGRGHGVGKDRHAAGVADQLHGRHRIHGVVARRSSANGRSAPRRTPRCGCGTTPAVTRASAMCGRPIVAAGRPMAGDHVPVHRIVLGEQLHHAPGAGDAGIAGLVDFLQQPRMRRDRADSRAGGR